MKWHFIGTAVIAVFLAACSSKTPEPPAKSATKEYFPESKYGVKASPRVANAGQAMPRGGGRYQVGKAYKVKDRWFTPKEDPNYKATGVASWYGSAFHGRLTANGEVYDKTHLTAAHPTLPLPSYARVTNTKNNSSVIVRINDRGPFARGRLIDLSEQAAEMLDYKSNGTATVNVEYIGPAALDGQDDAFLMASYRPAGVRPDPSDGLPTGVMIAMAGPTPTANQPVEIRPNDAFANIINANANGNPFNGAPAGMVPNGEGVNLPAFAPIPPARPAFGGYQMAALSYAEERIERASSLFDPILNKKIDQQTVSALRARHDTRQGTARQDIAGLSGSDINVGLLSSRAELQSISDAVKGFGRLAVDEIIIDGQTRYDVALVSVQADQLNNALKALWNNGAEDAFILHE